MDRLSIVLTLMTGAVLTGAFIVTAFTFGFYGWPTILGAAAIGFLLSWPMAYLISRWIKRDDPNWNHHRVKDTETVPDPNAREV